MIFSSNIDLLDLGEMVQQFNNNMMDSCVPNFFNKYLISNMSSRNIHFQQLNTLFFYRKNNLLRDRVL